MSNRKKTPQQKKKKQDWTKLLTQIAIVAVLIVCVVGFTLSTSFFSIFEKAREGSVVETDFTLIGVDGTVVVTSDLTVAQAAYNSGNFAPIQYGTVDYMLIAEPYDFTIGEVPNDTLVTIPVYLTDMEYMYSYGDYALFADEMVYLNDALEGLGTGDETAVIIPGETNFTRTMTAEQFELVEGDYNATMIGDWIALGFSETVNIAVDNATPEVSFRLAQVIDKGGDNITFMYGYPEIDLTVSSLTV